MLKFYSFFPLNDKLNPKPTFLFNPSQYIYNKDKDNLKKIMDESIKRTIENTKKLNITKYLNDYQIIVPPQQVNNNNNNNNNNNYNYIFYIISFLAGYHFRYFNEQNKNT